MTGIICAVIILVAALAVALMANSKRLYRLNVEASTVAQSLMYECLCNMETFKSYILENSRTELKFGSIRIKKGRWIWQNDFRPTVTAMFTVDDDVGPIYESFMHALEKYQSRKGERLPIRYAPIIRFRRKE